MKEERSVISEKPWVDGLTIGEAFDRTAARCADREALVFTSLDYRRTYREFQADVDAAARGLLAIGVGRGDHVAVWATNVPQWLVLQFATAKIGAVLVTVNPAYRAFELEYVLKQSDAKVLCLVDKFKTSDYFAMLQEVCPESTSAASSDGTRCEVRSEKFPRLKTIVALRGTAPAGFLAWDEMLRLGSAGHFDLRAAAEGLTCSQPINIQYTSGTTGFPKAATLSHRNLLLNAYYVGGCQRFSEQDRVCIPVPFYHCFGCVLGTLGAVVYGAAMIIPADSFNATATLDALERERPTALYGVPTMFIAQLQCPTFPARKITSLRTGIMSGAPCPIEIMRQVIDKLGPSELTIAYGQTEASPVITQTHCHDPIELRVETVGAPLTDVEVKVIDPATGATLGDEQQGELCTRGHLVMLGYYKDPAATAKAIDADGWLHTGDLAVRRPDGYYHITGRIKDMVIRGGENIYPREIEEYLFRHPSIEQASVVGLPDVKYGEELCAWIKLKTGTTATEDEIRAFVKAGLAHFKIPRYVRFVEAFPQTISGKIQKFKIREQMIEELKLVVQKMA
ncbi:MAG: AMP-binding protein [Planctomycetia bacterium]|nr:AMP-binding protein [Planctomycetia bacterium]